MTTNKKFLLNWPALIAKGLRFSSHFVKFTVVNTPFKPLSEKPSIFIHWHCDDLAMLPHFGNKNCDILISQSKDGDILAEAVQELNFGVCRGSSSRGGAGALVALKKSLEAGKNIILAADGPRGPRMVAKTGAFYLSLKTGFPIYALGAYSNYNFMFQKSWNKTYIPLPFSKLVVNFTDPIYLPKEAKNWSQVVQSRFLTKTISEIRRKAYFEYLKKYKSIASSTN